MPAALNNLAKASEPSEGWRYTITALTVDRVSLMVCMARSVGDSVNSGVDRVLLNILVPLECVNRECVSSLSFYDGLEKMTKMDVLVEKILLEVLFNLVFDCHKILVVGNVFNMSM